MWCPLGCATFSAQVWAKGFQGSASIHGDSAQIALKSAKCQSPVRCPSSRQAKITQTCRERSWVSLLKILILSQLVGMFSWSWSPVLDHPQLAGAVFPSQFRMSKERAADAFPEAAWPVLLHSLLCKPLAGVSEYQRGIFYQTQIDLSFPTKTSVRNEPGTGSSGRTLAAHWNSSAFMWCHKIIQKAYYWHLQERQSFPKKKIRSFPMLANIWWYFICRKLARVFSRMDSVLLLGRKTQQNLCACRYRSVCV